MATIMGPRFELSTLLQEWLWGLPRKNPTPNPSLAQRRIACFEKMIENQKQVSKDENKNMYLQKEYQNLYSKCHEDIVP